MLKFESYLQGIENEFRQQVWGLDIFPYSYLAVLKKFTKIWGGQLD